MPLTLATWNINSVRFRTGLVERFLKAFRPDVLCLQETKCLDHQFPAKVFRRLGYEHVFLNGYKGYHGVAVLSRRPFLDASARRFCDRDDGRHVAVTVESGAGPVVVHNLYVPAGGDEPDPAANPKFAHKLAFLDEMQGCMTGADGGRPAILVGDLNVAPYENDVWSHRQLLRVVSHTPVETARLEAIRVAGQWVDAVRHFVPAEQKLFTWWSYRARDWAAADRGRRLDHIWVSPHLAPRLAATEVVRAARGWDGPSDHVPVIARLG